MGNIILYIVAFLGGGLGVITTLYMIVSLFGVLFQKIYRKVKYGTSLFD